MLVLGIESSCDETAAAVVADSTHILSNVVRSQEELHARFFGVVPEIACRAHVESILPVIRAALSEANVSLDELGGVAVANRPGLVGALLVGVSAAKALAFCRDLPLVGVHHVEAHLFAARMERPSWLGQPLVGLVASGGHTSLYRSDDDDHFELLGSTIDDAAGEAFDKVAKVMRLSYPGGPIIDQLAKEGDPRAYRFPRTLFQPTSLDFSFSGIKTAVLYVCKGKNTHPSDPRLLPDVNLADVAASFQEAVVDVLATKIRRAVESTGIHRVAVGGGVACNSRLRDRLTREVEADLEVVFPRLSLCSDNAAMIAGLGSRLLAGGMRDDFTLDVRPTVR